MSEARGCPSCGTRLSSTVGEALCPACLLRLALAEAVDADREEAGFEGAARREDRYVVRAVMDDCAAATAYLAEDSVSGALLRLEVAKAAGAPTRARTAAGGVERRDGPRVLDSGITADGRAWVVTARDAFRRGERGWVLGSSVSR